MTPAPVGQRCPDHSGQPQGVQRITKGARRGVFEGTGALVTKTLVAINIAVYIITAAQGSGINSPGGTLFAKWVLFGPAVANGDWWRLITSTFLHASILHIAFNMYFLWFVGSAVEQALGRGRFLLVYIVSGLAGSAGALIASPNALTVGASGAIWGIMGAALVLEARRIYVFGGQAMGLVIINGEFTFLIPGVSIGGHVGGFVGGALCALAFSSFRRSPALATLSIAAIGVLSVGVAVAQVG